MKAPASTQSKVLAKEIRNLKIEKVKYMKPIILKRGDQMKCPMSNYVMERESGEDEVLLNDCFKEECAWWHKGSGNCAVLNIMYHLVDLTHILDRIEEKLPHIKEEP